MENYTDSETRQDLLFNKSNEPPQNDPMKLSPPLQLRNGTPPPAKQLDTLFIACCPIRKRVMSGIHKQGKVQVRMGNLPSVD